MGRVTGVFGANEVAARLMNLGDVSNSTTRQALRDGAKSIRDLAKDYAPYDTGALERAIVIKEEVGEDGRKVMVIGIDESKINPKSRAPVGQYAEEIHENFDDYEPGPGTLMKIHAGFDAGAQFIFRAAVELEPRIMQRVQAAIERALARMK